MQYADSMVDRALDDVDDIEDALSQLRDRALVNVVGYSGVRGAEIVRDPNDTRRQGLSWDDIDFETNHVVFSKAQKGSDRQLPLRTHGPLRRLQEILDPPSDEWPVFPTLHVPSFYKAVRAGVDNGDDLLESADPLEILREHDVAPPSLTTEGGRGVLKRLCEADHAGIAKGQARVSHAPRGPKRHRRGDVSKPRAGECG